MLQSLIVPLSMVIFGSLYTLTVDSVPGLSFGIMGVSFAFSYSPIEGLDTLFNPIADALL